jgi:ATP-dependent helicase/nuclease subunit A
MSGTPGGSEAIADATARRRAVDVTASFVVQAPAGSGKTGLLVQRFLALLALVERPEAVLAITFTRKAAGEMRRRIVEALREADKGGELPEPGFKRDRMVLARDVLERDRSLGWGLLHSPSRLQVFTIDGFCSRVVGGSPLLSRLGSTPATVDDAEPLYREAVRRTLAPAGREMLGDQLAILLERYEMGIERLEEQLVAMLSRRDQWSEAFFASRHDETTWVAEVEAAFRRAIEVEMASIAFDVEPGLAARIYDVARRSRANGCGEGWPTLGDDDLLGTGADAAWAWRQASSILLKKGKKGLAFRTRRTKDDDVHGGDAVLKADLAGLVGDLGDLPEETAARWLESLRAAVKLPRAPLFTEDGRQAVAAFATVLRHAFLNLWQVFREKRQVDHVEIAMRAVEALAPGETLERLDARIEHILIDEFQDTNVLQCNLLRGLTKGWQLGDGRTLFLVGDPMQSIYRFRKAEVGLFLSARSNPGFVPNVKLEPLALSVNFRSTRAIVDWVNGAFRVLLGDRDDAARSLVAFASADPGPDAEAGARVEMVLWEDSAGARDLDADAVEAAGLADWIAAECRNYREAPRDPAAASEVPVAVLVRARAHAIPLLRALERRAPELRIRAPGLDRLAHRSIVVDLEALTRALVHPGDRLSWLAVLRSPWVGLGLGEIASLVEPDVATSSSAKRRPIPLLLRDETALLRVSEEARRRITRWLDIADAARLELATRPLDLVVRSAWLRLGGPPSTGDAARLESLDADAFFDVLAAHIDGGSVQLDDLSRALVATDAAVDADLDADVEIMTMHKAKGLEFHTVVLPALGRSSGGSTRLPLAMETEPDSGVLRLVAPRGARGREDTDLDKYAFLQHRESRRGEAELLRLLYVAATRARKRLLLSSAEGRLNKSDRAPRSGSLLAALERAMDLGCADSKLVEPSAAAARPASTRFPAGFRLESAPESIADHSVATVRPSDLEQAPDYFADDKTAAAVGTVFHEFAERMAADGVETWSPARIAAERSRIEHALRAEGVLASAMEEAAGRVARALESMIEDERGRWILAAHEDARSEWALTSLRERRLVSAKLDRTFVAEGARWVVDFKTGPWNGGDGAAADRYVEERCSEYGPQLAGYRDLVRGSAGASAPPVRVALYFPEWPEGRRWHDVTDLVSRADAG